MFKMFFIDKILKHSWSRTRGPQLSPDWKKNHSMEPVWT